ncbi:Ig-like domain-containing protein [Parafilimonas sp.]|uniref:Ig-like domain-containing protein n=1 Tax=Parafilimonas sp. TaxID=1969739 RepID=UPI0039E46BDE
MKKLFPFIFILPACHLFAQPIDYKGLPQWSWHKEDSTEYYLYTPSDRKKGKKYPVVLALHGCCGTDYHARLRNTVDPIVRVWHNFSANTQKVPTYIIAPATSLGWQQHFDNLKKVIDDLIANQDADPQRIYVCGFSMGAEGAFHIIQQYPGYFAAAITMGMGFSGDPARVKNIPLWCNQGETDYFSRSLRKDIAGIRHVNGDVHDTGATWVTGVNPLYSSFKGYGHGIMWVAASTQDLTGWAYSKINDGNIYPTVFFRSPSYKQTANRGEKVTVDIDANDADGSIAKVEVFYGGSLVKTFKKAPFKLTLKAYRGDNAVKAVAYDNKGKASTAETILRVNVKPDISWQFLNDAQVGKFYSVKINGSGGNGDLVYSTDEKKLPPGLLLYPDGTLKGIPLIPASNYSIPVIVQDEDGDTASYVFNLRVPLKNRSDVLVTNAVSDRGIACPVSGMMPGESPFFNSKDTVLTTRTEEINFSDIGKYEGLTFIKTDINEKDTSADNFLSFNIDNDATVYVAYETLNANYHSTLPDWLNDFEKEDGQIVAQYRYYNVYSKSFPAGKVVLPPANAKANNVGTGYFVMVKKD